MPDWRLWNPALGKPGAKVPRLPAQAELSGDGKWATVWENGEAAAVFVACPTRVEVARDIRPIHRPSRRLFSGTLTEQKGEAE